MQDLDDLEKKAKAAAPIETDLYGDRYFDSYYSRADLTKQQDDYIATANPSTILDLIARCRKAEARVAELEAQSGDAAGHIVIDQINSKYVEVTYDFPHGELETLGVGRHPLYLRAPQDVPEWQPIETAPKGAKGYAWMYLSWGPDDDKNTGYGFHANGKFYAAATFFVLSGPRAFELREIEVSPTHWMPLPAAPSPEGDKK